MPKATRTRAVEQGPSLAEVIEALGPGVLRVLAAPRGLAAVIGTPVIHDPVDPPAIGAGDVVLAVGADPGRHDAIQLLEDAGAGDAAAVVFRLDGGPIPRLAAAAETAGVALLGVPREMAWTQVHSLLRTAVGAAGHAPEGAPGTGAVAVGDLFGLADAVAAMVGGAVTIEDPQSYVLAYSSGDYPIDEPRRRTILGHRVPEDWLQRLRKDGFFRRLWTSRDPVLIDYSPTRPKFAPRMAIAVRAGEEVLGSIWVAQGTTPLGPKAEAALREAAGIAALHLIRHRASEDLERRRRADLLRSVLEGNVPAEVGERALGFGDQETVTVMAFGLGGDGGADGAVRIERATDLIALHGEAFRRQAGCVAIGGTVYVLIPDAEPGPLRGAPDLARDIIDRTPDALRAGIAAPAKGLAALPASRAEADRVLRVLEHDPVRGPVATIEDVRSQAILLELADIARRAPQLAQGRLAALVEHDARRGTSYVQTLRAYLDAFGDVPAAARAISVHPNTFRYRIRRLAGLAGLDLEDPDERLVVHLQLRLLET